MIADSEDAAGSGEHVPAAGVAPGNPCQFVTFRVDLHEKKIAVSNALPLQNIINFDRFTLDCPPALSIQAGNKPGRWPAPTIWARMRKKPPHRFVGCGFIEYDAVRQLGFSEKQ